MPELKAMGMLNAKRGMVNIFGDTLSEVEIDTLVDTLVEKQARMQVKSLKNTLEKKAKQELLDTLAAWLSGVRVAKPCEALAEVEVQKLVDRLAGREKQLEVKKDKLSDRLAVVKVETVRCTLAKLW